MILLEIDRHFQNNGSLNFTITPFERELIKFYRNIKNRIPHLFKRNLTRIKRFIGGKNEI